MTKITKSVYYVVGEGEAMKHMDYGYQNTSQACPPHHPQTTTIVVLRPALHRYKQKRLLLMQKALSVLTCQNSGSVRVSLVSLPQ